MVHGRRIVPFFGAYEQQGKSAVISPGSGQQILLHSLVLQNRSGGTIDMGLGIKLDNTGFKVGKLVALNTPQLADATSAIQAGTATNIFTSTDNDGYLIQSSAKFSLVGFTISQVQTGSPVYAYEYWNGTAWTALPDVIATPGYLALTDTLLVFSPPRDWALGTDASVGGSSTMYSVRARATTHSNQAVKATAVWVAKFLHFQAQVPNNGLLSWVSSTDLDAPVLLDGGQGVLPFFATASALNLVTARYQSAD